MASSLDEHLLTNASIGVGTVVDSRGKHRILAELKRLEQELRYLQEELDEVEKMGNISSICKELNGVVNPSWNRWFEGSPSSPECSCWIL
ncbi:guanine nucleotide-binding protein subunit gamma 2 isoform X2 [Cucumis melo]|uniref:Guanine nucleotide-binding protein subunit gamma 2 isoform X2 n=1 Tax=Cucumis melo TaxID=3656 RepID=A0A1S3BMH6_CUCME|nr:guanine nucleotide-binding protein subunit gamma 2 isoform X2 [Cucumis melo]